MVADTHKTLSPKIELRFEREANQGSAELLFQVDLLTRIARDYPVEVSTPVALATMFGASLHSTFRRWIEGHAGQLCGIVLDPTPASVTPLTFQRFEVIGSSSWGTQLGRTASQGACPRPITSSSFRAGRPFHLTCRWTGA